MFRHFFDGSLRRQKVAREMTEEINRLADEVEPYIGELLHVKIAGAGDYFLASAVDFAILLVVGVICIPGLRWMPVMEVAAALLIVGTAYAAFGKKCIFPTEEELDHLNARLKRLRYEQRQAVSQMARLNQVISEVQEWAEELEGEVFAELAPGIGKCYASGRFPNPWKGRDGEDDKLGFCVSFDFWDNATWIGNKLAKLMEYNEGEIRARKKELRATS